MTRASLLALLLFSACDYATQENVERLARDVDGVKSTQRVLETKVDSAVQQNQALQTSVSAMGSGFNVLTQSMVDQGGRVETLEARSVALTRDLSQVRKAVDRSGGSPSRGAEPDRVGTYLGSRVDVMTLTEEPVRMQWCEAAEGTQGYLVPVGVEPDYRTLRCWRFGSVAIFREESPQGPIVRCLRDITVTDGALEALDCKDSGVYYRMGLR